MKSRLWSWVALLAFALAGAEVTLRLLAWTMERVSGPATSAVALSVPDERLGSRPNPAYPGHDARGFRNAEALASADIVALGDSQTYGVGVAGEDSWPVVLARLTGRRTYGMAFGGWGPVHSLALFDEALALRPSLVIEALYSGNDFYDSFSAVYGDGPFADLRSTDGEILAAIAAVENERPLGAAAGDAFQVLVHGSRRNQGLSAWLGERSLVHRTLAEAYRRGRASWRARALEALDGEERAHEEARLWASQRPGAVLLVDQPGCNTILTPSYRLLGLDPEDVRIQEGRRIAVEVVARMASAAERAGVEFLVLLLPTKELVFAESARAWAPRDPGYEELLRHELALWDGIRDELTERGIPFVDVLPDLRAALAEGHMPYPSSWDGHPNALGHHLIAGALARKLDRSSVARPPPLG